MNKYFVRRVTYTGEPCEGRREEVVKKFETFEEALEYLKPYGVHDYGIEFAISKARYIGDIREYYVASLF